MEKKSGIVILFSFLAGILILLFWPSFLGQPIQGIDGSIGIIRAVQASISHSLGQWHASYWMGIGSTDYYPSLYYLGLRIFPSMWFQNLYYPLALLLAITGMWVWLRAMGRSLWAALFGAIAYGLMPHWVSLVFGGHILVFEAMAWLPWLFWGLGHTFRENSWRWVLWAGISGVLWGTIMNADIQRGLYLSLVAASMTALIWYQKNPQAFWKKLPINLGKSLVVSAFLFSIASVALGGWWGILEGRQAARETQNLAIGGWEFATMFSQNPRELVNSLAFGYHGKLSGDPEHPYWGTKEFHGNTDSLGFFLFVFGIMGILLFFHKDTHKQDKLWLGFWGIWALLGLLLAFGRYWPGKPFYWLFYHLPLMSSFRVPLKWLIVTGFALVLTGSYAFDRILLWAKNNNTSSMKKALQASVVLVGIGIVWLFYHAITADGLHQRLHATLRGLALTAVENRGWAILRMTALFTLLTASAGLVFVSLTQKLSPQNKRLSQRVALGLVFGGMLFDLISANSFYFDKAFVDEGPAFYRKDELLSNITKNPMPFRIASSLLIEQNGRIHPMPASSIRQAYLTYDFLYHGIEAFDIPAESAVDASLQRFMLAGWKSSGITQAQDLNDLLDANLPIFRMANVTHLILDALVTNENYPLLGIWRSKGGQRHAVYGISSLPRLAWFSEAVSVVDETAAFELFSQPNWQRERVLIVENASTLTVSTPPATISLQSYLPVAVQAQINAPSDGYVLFANRYHRQWHAELNGQPIPIHKANIAQMAVFVPAGTHTLEFSYQPAVLPQIFAWGTLIIAVVAGAVLLVTRARAAKETA